MLKWWKSYVFLDLSFTICVRGATDFQNFEDVPSETARLLKDGRTDGRTDALTPSELYSLGEVRMRIH